MSEREKDLEVGLKQALAGMELAYGAIGLGLYNEALMHLGHYIGKARNTLDPQPRLRGETVDKVMLDDTGA